MRICDICGDKMDYKGQVEITNKFFDKNYELCVKCARKVEKYINFEQVRYKKDMKNKR